ncbi:MAG: hypothetical protein INF88_11510 [Roseomonas sp.]|nr:hypothetical protein [Roseomonas sp.]
MMAAFPSPYRGDCATARRARQAAGLAKRDGDKRGDEKRGYCKKAKAKQKKDQPGQRISSA